MPSLDWLEPLSEDRYGQGDLDRFGVLPRTERDENLAFSLIRRPSPYIHAPWMALVDESVGVGRWDNVMSHLSHWLLRHLDDPKLVLWLTARGIPIHREFAERVEWRLRELDGLVQGGKTDELNRICEQAPRAIPRPAMRTLWRLLLSGRVKTSMARSAGSPALSLPCPGGPCARRMIPLESPVPEIGTPGSVSGDWKRDHGSRTEMP